MKKSFRPSRTSRPISRPSASRPTIRPSSSKVSFRPSSSKESFSPGSSKESFSSSSRATGGIDSGSVFQGKESGVGGVAYGGKKGTPFFSRARWGRRSTPLISGVVIIICCLLFACIALIYAFTQGLINLPSF